MNQIHKDNAHYFHFHFHNRKNIERLEKADLTESDEDDDDDEDDLEVIEFQAKKVGCLFYLQQYHQIWSWHRAINCLYTVYTV